jgi:hypothetical protein
MRIVVAILLLAGQAQADVSVAPGWATLCEARLERARLEAARRDPAFGQAIVRFTEKDLSSRGWFSGEEAPLVEMIHAAYAKIPDVETLAFRVLVSKMEDPREDDGWHWPDNGSLGDPNDMDVYEVKYAHGWKGKLELWAPTPKQRRIFNQLLRRAVDDCLRITSRRRP